MDFPVIISFYTKRTPYEKEAEKLIASCEKLGLESVIEGIDTFGTWELNCAYKPFFILEKLEQLQKPLLWVDADAAFVGKPKWEEAFDAAFAVYLEPELSDADRSKVRSGTVFVQPKGKPLLKEWIKHCYLQISDPNRKKEFWDQMALRDAVLNAQIQVASLPLAYVKIFDHPLDTLRVREPIIEHYQASRNFKEG